MAQRNFLPRGRRSLWRAPGLLLCLLAGPLAHAASVTVEVRGVADEVRDNVLAFLSFERFRRGGVDLNADTVERLHNRVEREVDAALRPFGYYEPKVESTVAEQGRGDWRVVIDINPGPPVLLDHVDVRVDGAGESDPLFRRILNNLPLHSGDRLSHAAYDAVKADLQRTAATFGYLGEPLFERPFYATIKASHSALGSQADFVQIHLEATRVFNLVPKWHLLMRGEIGTTFVRDFNELPAVYRFFAGGDNSVRGFAYNELSPLEGPECATNSAGQVVLTANGSCQPKPGYYLKTGGKDLLTGTVEVIRELPRNLGVAAFFDYGNALNSFHKPECVPGTMPGTTICPPFIQYSVGIGLRVRLPVMTLGDDIAQPLSTNAGPRLHINFSPKL